MWKLVVIPALLALVRSEYPLDVFDEPVFRNDVDPTIYRIPESLDPIHYDVEITPYFEAEEGKEAFTFDGIVTLEVRAVENDISVLTIQENVRTIESVSLTTEAGQPVLLNETDPFTRVRQYHFLNINLRSGVTLVNGAIYILRIVYIGNINETPLSRGIFRGYYTDRNGVKHWYAASHLQPVNSRQAFPSFDEPGFKSTFTIIVNRPVSYGKTFSNMEIAQVFEQGNRVKEIFYETPRMSAYLVTIHISEEFDVIADNDNVNRSYRIIARPEAADQGAYALEIGTPLTNWLGAYFGIDYYDMGKDMKNDQIAVPDWASGATENWGLVSYRELRLLNLDDETNAVDKMSIGTITAHELAHKWFGNLITCRWWDNVWINEGFASYFEYFAMDGIDKDMELADQFNIMYLQSALSTDSGLNTRALQHTVNSPAEVTGHFSGISYSKGASLLQMLKHFLGEDIFKSALNHFLVAKSYEHAYPEDLYTSFAAIVQQSNLNLGVDITNFMRYWVDEPGYPILNVDVNMGTGLIKLEQERFYLSTAGSPSDQVWPLPLTYTTQNNADWNTLSSPHVMTGKTYEIQKDPGHEWVIFNVQQRGIYRVNYDTHSWEMLASALKSDRSSINFLNRAQIVDDVFALMRSEKITYELGFQVLDFLKEETNYYVWYPAITGFNWLRNRFLHLPDVLEEFDEILYTFLDAIITDVGYDFVSGEALTRTLNRFYVLSFACNIGHEGCLNDASAKFTALRANSNARVNPNLRRHVFCVGLHDGNYEDWLFMHQRRQASQNQADMVAMLRAMGCTTDERALQEHMRNILDDDIVKAQDRVNAFTFLYMGDRSNARVALQFVKENIDEIRRKVVLQSWSDSIISNLASYLDAEGLQDMEEWLRANQASIPEADWGFDSIISSRNSMQWGTDNAQIILEAARGSAIVVLPTTMLLFTTLIALFLK